MFRIARFSALLWAGFFLTGCGSDTPAPAEPGPFDAAADVSAEDVADSASDGAESGPADSSVEAGALALRPDVTIDTYPRVDGATSSLPLAMVIACELLGLPWKWTDGWDEESQDYIRNVTPDPRTPDQVVLAAQVVEKIVHHKTYKAYLRLIEDQTDLIVVASLPSLEEAQYAAEVGVTLSARPIALDALVFLVNGENPVSGLTTEQIRDIYLGDTRRWSEVGGLDSEIHPYVRPTNAGSQQLMDTLVMDGLSMPLWPPDHEMQAMGEWTNSLMADPDAIGYSSYYYMTHMVSAERLKTIGVDGEDPTAPTVRTKTYPYTAEVWVVTRSNLPRDSVAGQLSNWLLSSDGQGVVWLSGYVPVRM